ncbi:MAG: hypothetical protein HPY54_12635 [Chthonomonadetes bacterium]|nr:hypothetical protein [Chthonomonadetes bacterium]
MDNDGKRMLVLVIAVAVVVLAVIAWWWSGRSGSAPAGQELQQIQAERAMKREK